MPKKQYPAKPPKKQNQLFELSIKVLKGCAMREIDGVGRINAYRGTTYETQTTAEALLRNLTAKIFNVTGYPDHTASIEQCKAGIRPWQPFIIFSDVDREPDRGGFAFAAFIKENNLGRVTASNRIQSWTQNFVTMWVWEVDYEALAAWCDKLDAADAEKAAKEAAARVDSEGPAQPTSGRRVVPRSNSVVEGSTVRSPIVSDRGA